MFQTVGILCTVATLGIIVVECTIRQNMDYHQDQSVQCYECSSQYDPRCGDPFDPYTIAIVNCSMKRPLNHITEKPTFCRKIVQKVQGNVRVIRGCGYIPDEREGRDCLLRTGTHDVHVRYCSCKGNYCNTGSLQQSRPTRIVLGAIVLAITRLIQKA